MILIVEDEANISRFYSVNLRTRNYDVIETTTVQGALQIIERQLPSLMVLDIRLPDLRGWDLLRILEEQQIGYFPVIVATASVSPSEIQQHEFSRISHILFKPIKARELLQAVEEALNSDARPSKTIGV